MDGTDTWASEAAGSSGRGPEWSLAVALDCERLNAPPLRLSLAGIDEVEIGRGAERTVRRTGSHMRIELPDRWSSQVNTRLSRADGAWVAEDAGSKNGTHVNGRRIERAPLVDGDVVECGGTFMVLRHAAGTARDLELARTDALATIAPALEQELAVLPKIARSRVPVVVRGDSGTGKELIASAIHALSGRGGALVAVNCGAIPATLVESELFGSRRGAFSGAEDRPGLVRNADRGTLFLDEVAELPAPAQASLLRMLQEGEIQPLGAGKPIEVDVRVVAATHQPVEELVADGRFRRDLYARLRGYEVRLPSLRARLEDLGLLVAALLARLDPGGGPRTLSRTAARALFNYAWPFQVRELEQVLRAAIALATRPEIGLDDLPITVREPRSEPVSITPAPGGGEREQLVALLEKHGGNLSAVARDLATSRSQVQRLLARHGLAPDDYKRGG